MKQLAAAAGQTTAWLAVAVLLFALPIIAVCAMPVVLIGASPEALALRRAVMCWLARFDWTMIAIAALVFLTATAWAMLRG